MDAMPLDPTQIALELIGRSTPRGDGASGLKEILEADYTPDAEQVNGFGVYSSGREAIYAAAQKAVGKTTGTSSEVVSATLLADNVILAHVLSSANVPEGPFAGTVRFRFTLVIVRQDSSWKIRSMSTTLVRDDLPA